MARYICTDDGSNIQHYDVVIVGGGIAGIAAAHTLLDAGVTNLVVLEAQDHPGGRIFSVPISTADNHIHSEFVEAGAQWLHGQGNQVYKIAENKNLLSSVISDEGQGLYLRYDSTEIPLQIVQEVAGIVGSVLEDCEKFIDQDDCVPHSVGKYLSEEFAKYLDLCQDSPSVLQDKKDLFNWHERFLVIDNSCDNLNNLSAKAWGYYKFTGGQDYLNFKHGYKSLIDSLVDDLPEGVLKLNSPAINIDWSKYVAVETEEKLNCELSNGISYVCDSSGFLENGFMNKLDPGNICNKEYSVVVTDKNIIQYHAEHVIVTCSIGFLKANHESLFRPLLPQTLQKTINLMGYDTINKIFLIYEKPWWPDDVQGYQLIWSTDTVSCPEQKTWMYGLTGFDVLSNNKSVLVGWIGGKGAVEVESVTEDEIAEKCTQLLKSFTAKSDIPLPHKVVRSQWHSNRYVLGAYSHTTSSCDNYIGCGPNSLNTPVCVKKNSVKNEHPVILLAGEAAHESHFSTTHGAFESGQNQAKVIIDYMTNTK